MREHLGVLLAVEMDLQRSRELILCVKFKNKRSLSPIRLKWNLSDKIANKINQNFGLRAPSDSEEVATLKRESDAVSIAVCAVASSC